MNFQPVIKWSGSKRSQSNEIIKRFPLNINVYYEPFCGGCSMLMRLMLSDIKVNQYICSDLNKDLINIWNEIKDNPREVIEYYTNLWHDMNDSDDDKDRKRDFFNNIRKRYNEYRNPYDFMFIMRTTTNGMPRYNKKGEFNNSFHITRNGIIPKTLEKHIYFWNKYLNDNNVHFVHQSYDKIQTNYNDFMYLDPPYANTKGMYFDNFETNNLWVWLKKQDCKYLLSYDGISGEFNNTYDVPDYLYNKHEYLLSGNSSFKRTTGKSNDSIVYESLYIKY